MIEVEAEVRRLMSVIDRSGVIAGNRRSTVEAALHAALQASAAAVEPAAWRRRVPVLNSYTYEYVSHWSTKTGEGWEPLYTAPPLPAQVQAAEGLTPAEHGTRPDILMRLGCLKVGYLRSPTASKRDKACDELAEIIRELSSLASRTPAPGMAGGVGAMDREQLIDLINEHLICMYHCTRVWEAWNVGTMTRDDFIYAPESDTAAELADAILAAPHPSPAPQAAGVALTWEKAEALARDWGEVTTKHRGDNGLPYANVSMTVTRFMNAVNAAIEAGRAGS